MSRDIIYKNKNRDGVQTVIDNIVNANIHNLKGYDTILHKLNKAIKRIIMNRSYLILGESGTGKSTFLYSVIYFRIVDIIFLDILNKYDNDKLEILKQEHLSYLTDIRLAESSKRKYEYKLNKYKLLDEVIIEIKKTIYIRLFSLEISFDRIIIKAIAYRLFMLFQETISTNTLLKLNGDYDDKLKIALELFDIRFFMTLLEIITNVDTNQSYINIMNVVRDDLSIVDNIENKFSNRPMYFLYLDHPSLMETEIELRLSINKISKFFMSLKNNEYASTFMVQQVNPNAESKKNNKFLIPDFEQVRDTKATYMDTDIAIALACPNKKGYATYDYGNGTYYLEPSNDTGGLGLGDSLIVGQVLKNRDGATLKFAMDFNGAAGVFLDIPKPEELTNEDYVHIMDRIDKYENNKVNHKNKLI